MSVAEIKAQVNASTQQASEASGGCGSVRQQLDNALQQLTQATLESNHPKPREAEVQWREAQSKLDEVMRLIQSGHQACDEFVSTI